MGDYEYLFHNILRFKEDISKRSPYAATLELYALKLLIYNNGNFSNISNLNLKVYGLDDLGKELYLSGKDYGFDFLLIPLQLNTDINVYNSILRKFFHQENLFNDSKISEEANNNIDILFCLFSNFHFSRYYISEYFSCPEYNNIKEYFSIIKEKILNYDEIITKLFLYFFNI